MLSRGEQDSRSTSVRRDASAFALVCFVGLSGCFRTPDTTVIVDNTYEPSVVGSRVIYRATWEAVQIDAPILPGASSDPQPTVPASDNTAYVLLAPGWNPASTTPPTSFIVMQSRLGFAVDLYGTLHIPVDDATFAGSCDAQSPLTQAQADFITQSVFPEVFAHVHYDAFNCITSPASAP